MAGLTIPITNIINHGISVNRFAQFTVTLNCAKSIELQKPLTLEINRNYAENYSDEIFMEIYMPLGDYLEFVQPAKKSLTATIIQNRGRNYSTHTYKAYVINDDSSEISPTFKTATFEDLNKELAYVKFQLVEMNFFKMWHKTTFGTIKNKDILQLLTTLIGDTWLQINTPNDKYNKVLSFVTPFDNTQSYRVFRLAPNLSIVDLPSFIHRGEYGIYDGEIGSYIQPIETLNSNGDIVKRQRPFWIYPTMTTKIEKRKGKKLKLYVAQSRMYKDIERTFKTDTNSDVELIVTTDDDIGAQVEQKRMAETDADVYRSIEHTWTRQFSPTAPGQPIMVNPEMFSKDYSVDSSENHKRTNPVGSNGFIYKFHKMKISGFMIRVMWKFSFPDILYPGMILTLYYEELVNGHMTVKNIKGVLQGSFTAISNDNRMSVTTLYLYLNNNNI